jgi:putative Mg2+ transporter-C (MgtC) family protein
MPLDLGWDEIALRLLLTTVAGFLIGFNREEAGRPAGLRTILLVSLAASVAMILANLLMKTSGKPERSFISLDVMRLPLGVLTGMGFIGGGAILKRGDTVVGVTTAATLWFVTVVGLCFGCGQVVLGSVVVALGLFVLWGLKWVELQLPYQRRGVLILTLGANGPGDEDIRRSVIASGFQIVSLGVTRDLAASRRVLRCELRWRTRAGLGQEPALVDELTQLPGVAKLQWHPQGTGA